MRFFYDFSSGMGRKARSARDWGTKTTLGQKPTFYPEIPGFHRILCLKNVNLVKNETLKMWILSKNEIFKLWILLKMRFWKCEFCHKWDVQNMNFVKNEDFEIVNFDQKKRGFENCEFWQ